MYDDIMPEAFCPTCGATTLMIKEPVYDGFTRIGDQIRCSVCGAVTAPPPENTEVKKTPSLFTDDDRSPAIQLFGEGENRILCRYCTHYTVNPFRQWCGLHFREVEATDTCDRFEAKPEPAPPSL